MEYIYDDLFPTHIKIEIAIDFASELNKPFQKKLKNKILSFVRFVDILNIPCYK